MFGTHVKILQRLLRNKHTVFGKVSCSRLVLGIETSCDETGAAVLDETGVTLGESLHSQKEAHLRTGGIIPLVAQQLHRENIERVVQEALERSGVSPGQLSAVATTVKPGLALSLSVGLEFSQMFVRQHNKPFIPIHHMEAHALTVRMLWPISFPFLVLLVSGGHSLLAVARGVDDFLLLGHTLDESPGDLLDKVARRLSLIKHPQCSSLSGGQAIELLAKDGDRKRFNLPTPMGHIYDCCFSFAGLKTQIMRTIKKMETEEGVEEGTLLSCVKDIAAATQHTVASHLAKRTHRAILFCKANNLLPSDDPALSKIYQSPLPDFGTGEDGTSFLQSKLVLSGGVASNEHIRKVLTFIAESTGLCLICPPTKLCTDNGVMIAWNGVERLREGKGILPPNVDVFYEPKAPLGVDITEEVRAAAIRLPPVRIKI